MLHPLRHRIGKPFEVWCLNLFENSLENSIVPLDSIESVLLTAVFKVEDEEVLVTVLLV